MTWGFTAVALMAATAAMSYTSGQQQLKATQDAANENYKNQLAANELRQTEINKQAANDETERSRMAQIERGRMRVISGESGAIGGTQDRLLKDSYFQEGSDLATLEANRESSIKQSVVDANSFRAQNQGVMNQAASRAPTLLGTGLQIASNTAAYNAKVKSKNTTVVPQEG